MTGLLDSASAILLSSERRLESSANNIANSSTTGFKRQVNFSDLISPDGAENTATPELHFLNDFSQGQLTLSEYPLDLAIFGPGFLRLRDGEDMVYSRGGSFHLAEGGVVANAEGHILQQVAGGDLIVSGGMLEFLDDGTVLEEGLPVGTVGLWEISYDGAAQALGGSLFSMGEDGASEAQNSQLRQGFRENSNVVMSDEMISMMTAVRRAESAGRIVQFYDQLVGQAIQTFSRRG